MHKSLPVLKTDRDLELEGLARLASEISRLELEPRKTLLKPPTDDVYGHRHSIGFDVPGAVHTILTPSK
jgi:uncharacterized protein (UPF0335 family)